VVLIRIACNEGYNSCWRIRHATLANNQRYQQTTDANLRQTDGLLPTDDINVSRHQRHPNNHNARRQFQRLLGDGSQWGIKLSYEIQPSPDGLAQAFMIGEKFIGTDKVALVLGDNIFHGHALSDSLKHCIDPDGGIVFAYQVSDPQRYGVVEFNDQLQAISIEEKPVSPKSNYAGVGLYFYDNDVIEIAKNIQPSQRNELEITSINEEYLHRSKLHVTTLDDGDVWLDTGTIDSMAEAADYVRVIQKRTGQIIGSPEKIAYEEGFIDTKQLVEVAEPLIKSGYGGYLV
jgi:glucose-1-phosphate thymidylyltransferase